MRTSSRSFGCHTLALCAHAASCLVCAYTTRNAVKDGVMFKKLTDVRSQKDEEEAQIRSRSERLRVAGEAGMQRPDADRGLRRKGKNPVWEVETLVQFAEDGSEARLGPTRGCTAAAESDQFHAYQSCVTLLGLRPRCAVTRATCTAAAPPWLTRPHTVLGPFFLCALCGSIGD